MGKIGHREFRELLAAEFPEVVAAITDVEEGLLHLEVALFRDFTERAMDAGQFWTAERHFRFVDRVMPKADDYVENALAVSYIEDLALGECTPRRHRAVRERMPARLRRERLLVSQNWR